MDDIPILPIIYTHKLVEMMQEESIDSGYILRESGISPSLMTRPDAMLTFRQAHAVTSHYMGLSSRTLPALRFGLRLDLISHGLLGHVYLWRGEFGELIESMIGYLRVRIPLMHIELARADDHFSLRLACHPRMKDMEKFLVQSFMGSLHALGSAVTRNIVIYCRHDLFADVKIAKSIMNIEIHNDHDCNEMRFYSSAVKPQIPAKTAETDQPDRSSELFQEHGFVVRLRTLLLGSLRSNQSAEEIASELGMSERTLRRRLADCDMSFNKMRTEVRMQVAMRYLTTTGISIERIADLVGYSDQATFTRAFREWGGSTPNSIRSQRVQSLRNGSALLTAAGAQEESTNAAPASS